LRAAGMVGSWGAATGFATARQVAVHIVDTIIQDVHEANVSLGPSWLKARK
jgi:hypothetical protein